MILHKCQVLNKNNFVIVLVKFDSIETIRRRMECGNKSMLNIYMAGQQALLTRFSQKNNFKNLKSVAFTEYQFAGK